MSVHSDNILKNSPPFDTFTFTVFICVVGKKTEMKNERMRERKRQKIR